MEVTRQKGTESGYDYTIQKDNKVLRIVFASNLDLYWTLTNLEADKSLDHLYDEQYETFLITKENNHIYELFKKLVSDIKTPRVYEPLRREVLDEEDLPDPEIAEMLADFDNGKSEEERCNEWNEELKNSERYKKLYDGENIRWHSDDDYYADADRVMITELEDSILLEFYRPENTLKTLGFRIPGTLTIRFRNSGSTYDPLNIVFMKMYQQLQEYDPDYHQMHIEEIEYQKKLKKVDK
ncbi:MAG: hypothetical protein E7171_02530 [Firmicutes bacterium]|nr:hypothetical protein [Bacillota bacterium]